MSITFLFDWFQGGYRRIVELKKRVITQTYHQGSLTLPEGLLMFSELQTRL